MSVMQILEELPKLTREELVIVASRLADVEAGKEQSLAAPRTPGLGKGKWWVAEDFDAPLPDEFWLGEDA